MKLSKYQKDVEDVYLNSDKNIFMSATAGSGKSTTLIHLCNITPKYKRILFLAFNKSIVDELSSRLPNNVEVKTLHGKGLSILKTSRVCSWKLGDGKNYGELIKMMDMKHYKNRKEMNRSAFEICKLYDLIRVNLVDIENKKAIKDVGERWGLFPSNVEIMYVQKLYKENEFKRDRLNNPSYKMDYLDMLWLPYKCLESEDFPKYDVVFIDEAQDINPLQREMILRLIKKTGRFVCVGDFSQAIYHFQGASTESFRFFEHYPNTTKLPLPISYRCCQSVVLEARQYTDRMEWRENAPVGVVKRGTLDEVKESDMVLCRNNKPLIEAFLLFLQKNLRCRILGKDLGNSLIRMMEQAGSIEKMEDELDLLKADLFRRGVKNPLKSEKYSSLKEKIDIIKILVGMFDDYQFTIQALDSIFTDEKGDEDEILLSTIHKSKGLEADTVFIIGFEELIPSEYAVTEEELKAEDCLKFVAITRAKNTLVFVPCNNKK